MPNITPEIMAEIQARTGAKDLASTQFNIQLPSGEVIPAGINPGQAATIIIGGGVQDRGGVPNLTPSGTPPLAPVVPPQNFVPGATVSTPITTTSTSRVEHPIGNVIADPLTGKQYILGPQGTYIPYVPPAETPSGTPSSLNLSQGGGSSPSDYIKNLSTAVNSLMGLPADSPLANIRKQVENYFSQQPSRSSILLEEMKRYGVEEKLGISNQLSKDILTAQQELRDIKPNLKKTLENAGISEEQLNRLTEQASVKPRETLARLLEKKGVAQDDINTAMTFVKLFADTKFEESAARLKALEFELKFKEGDFQDLRENQKIILQHAFQDQENKMRIANDALNNGAGSTPEGQKLVDAIMASSSSAVALGLLSHSQYGEKRKDMQIIGSQETGYYEYNPITHEKRFTGIGGTGNATTENILNVYSSIIDKALANNASPQEAVLGAVAVGQNIGTKIDPSSQNALLQYAIKKSQQNATQIKTIPTSTTAPVYGGGNFAQIDIYDRIKTLRNVGFVGEALRNELIKNGYNSSDVNIAVQSTSSNVVEGIANFFGGLF